MGLKIFIPRAMSTFGKRVTTPKLSLAISRDPLKKLFKQIPEIKINELLKILKRSVGRPSGLGALLCFKENTTFLSLLKRKGQ
jgi:hypothetical protein